MRRIVAFLVVFGLPVPSFGDLVQGTRGVVTEKEHRIVVTMGRGHATLVVRRTVENRGDRHDQAVFWLTLPAESVATGLRTLGLRDGRPAWFAGELMEAEAAARKYQTLTGIGGYYPKDPALLSWRGQGELALQVFPVSPFERKTVEYTLVVPTTYRDGREHLTLPRLGTEDAAPEVMVRPARIGDRIFVEERPYAIGTSVPWATLAHEPAVPTLAKIDESDDESDDDDDTVVDRDRDGDSGRAVGAGRASSPNVDVAMAWDKAPLLGGRLAEKPLSSDRILVHYRVEAAPRLSQIPRAAQIVVLVDGSRSLDDDQRSAQLAAARAYLGHFEDARVQVLIFDRRVTLVHARPVPVARAIVDLERLDVTPRNGSQIDAALHTADTLLTRQAPGPRRVILLTDLLTRKSLDPGSLKAALANSGALLHIGDIDDGVPSLSVDDDSAWAPVARATGGLVWRAAARAGDRWQPPARAAYEEWARPIRVRLFRIAGAGLSGLDDDPPDELKEGQSASLLRIHGVRVPEIHVGGELWARRVHAVLRPDAVETRLWSALAFGSDVLGELSEPEMMILARHGRAVSPVTSYLAIEPGVRPSTEGLTEEEGLGSGFGRGAIGFGNLGGVGSGGASFDHLAFLRAELLTRWQACGGRSRRATVHMETTHVEIVDVSDVTANARTSEVRCLREAAWSLELPDAFNASHAAWTVTL